MKHLAVPPRGTLDNNAGPRIGNVKRETHERTLSGADRRRAESPFSGATLLIVNNEGIIDAQTASGAAAAAATKEFYHL